MSVNAINVTTPQCHNKKYNMKSIMLATALITGTPMLLTGCGEEDRFISSIRNDKIKFVEDAQKNPLSQIKNFKNQKFYTRNSSERVNNISFDYATKSIDAEIFSSLENKNFNGFIQVIDNEKVTKTKYEIDGLVSDKDVALINLSNPETNEKKSIKLKCERDSNNDIKTINIYDANDKLLSSENILAKGSGAKNIVIALGILAILGITAKGIVSR